MLSRADLRKIAAARIRDAEALYRAKRYDGAIYLCGYALECRLKARICVALRWSGFPSTKKEFEGLGSFKTHNLDVLLLLSGRETRIKTPHFFNAWTDVARWDPEIRYNPVGSAKKPDALRMIQSVRLLLTAL